MVVEKVKRYIQENELMGDYTTVVVGFSGGADSMALLDILIQLGYRCVAAHCNFHLRGEESDRDARFAQQWCKERSIQFEIVDFDTVGYADSNKISIEMAARDLRYGWFEELRQKYDSDAIAVAHHKDDSVETMLLNLSRGTGISGLRGILPKNGYVVRPLLAISREEIEQYLSRKDIPYRTDSTNKEDIYRRNYIRLNIIPALRKLNPSVSEALFRTSKNLAEVEKIYRNAIYASIKKVLNDGRIDINLLMEEVSPQAVLYEILSPMGFTPSVVDDVAQSVYGESGRVFYSDTHRLIKDRDSFIIDELNDSEDDDAVFYINDVQSRLETPVSLVMQTIPRPELFEKSNRVLYVDRNKLVFPLMLRRWEHGDWFIPFGMKGRKKVSDYFTDQKLSVKDKGETWLLFSDEKLVWIVGHRSDNRFRVDESTTEVLRVEWID